MIRAALLATLATSSPALAAPDCYQRFYSQAHMAANPGQSVQGLVLSFHPLDEGGRGIQLWAELSPEAEGLAPGDIGERYFSDMRCEPGGGFGAGADPEAETCFDTCDQGFVQIVQESDSRLLIRSFSLGLHRTPAACDGGTVLADRDESGNWVTTTFRLDGTAEADCEG
ncbi:hypothetical protein [Vannielia litorea]|uniref:hypothetical protein n=1 Tax=Vannielia litorea TaxID=1217970 RepID=UPI001BCE0204|nr:hypothetical protein [Vannielia litorea]MBS8228046.1 hypothetical protein [Vannielia litorea]